MGFVTYHQRNQRTTAISNGQYRHPVGDIKILMGDMNANLEEDNTGRQLIMGRETLSETMNENGELFADLCASNDLVIGGKDIHKATCIQLHHSDILHEKSDRPHFNVRKVET
ncbi:unnamed protein product [Heterobilharzia americana]|nr:unnamed protein product [Heterobilharzia americana]